MIDTYSICRTKLQEINEAFDNELRRLLNSCTCARIRTDCVDFRTGGGGGGGADITVQVSPAPPPILASDCGAPAIFILVFTTCIEPKQKTFTPRIKSYGPIVQQESGHAQPILP